METLINNIQNFGIIGSLILILLEYACFPISSEIVLPLTGIIIERENESLILIILLSVVFGLIGSIICYVIGRFGGKIIEKRIKINEFLKYGSKASFFCRLIPITRTYISFFQGMKKENFFRFVFYTSLGILLWNSVLITIGYYIGNNQELINLIINKYRYFLLIIVIFISLKLIIKYNKRKN